MAVTERAERVRLVMGPDTLWWGGCAWDAFAIPNLVPGAPEVLVATTCPACGTAHAWTVTNADPPDGDQVAHFPTAVDRIWVPAGRRTHQQLPGRRWRLCGVAARARGEKWGSAGRGNPRQLRS